MKLAEFLEQFSFRSESQMEDLTLYRPAGLRMNALVELACLREGQATDLLLAWPLLTHPQERVWAEELVSGYTLQIADGQTNPDVLSPGQRTLGGAKVVTRELSQSAGLAIAVGSLTQKFCRQCCSPLPEGSELCWRCQAPTRESWLSKLMGR